ncbi:hypothetical protein JN853_10630 [Pseudomonas syringae pv. actinidiae ICMP 9853]|nr:hypothetical protein JN853_10630 [Pseudomonas syringae pv. actinidiae ICMP 9853]
MSSILDEIREKAGSMSNCTGCAARREWIKKWSKVAYERAQQLFTQPDPGRAGEADRAAAEPD